MATVSIQVPMLETKLPVQTVANARCRNGRNGETRFGWAGLVTRQGYPRPASPAPGLLQGDPEHVERLGGATHPAAPLDDRRPAGEDAAAGRAEHRDRPGVVLGSDILKGSADGQVEEAVVVVVVQEEPAGQGPSEVVEVLGVALLEEAAGARAGD